MVRPAYHFTPAAGWTNDPLGLRVRPDGTAELFVQYVPGQTSWAIGCTWLRLTSPDLLHWTQAEVVLAPGDGDVGIWTGCVTGPADHPVALYTAAQEPTLGIGRIRSAQGSPGGGPWVKGPVVADLPDRVDAKNFRDPVVVQDGPDRWLLVGAGLHDGTAAVVGYRWDGEQWAYHGLTAERGSTEHAGCWTGSMWECPQLLRLVTPGHPVDLLVVSVWDAEVLHRVAGATGAFRDGRFEVTRWHPLTHGPGYYAATGFQDGQGRPGLVHWIRGVGGPDAGWTGALSVPHQVDLVAGRPRLQPHPCVAAARTGDAVRVPAGTAAALPSWHCDVEVTLPQGAVGQGAVGQGGVGLVRLDAAGTALLTVSAGPDAVQLDWLSADGPQSVSLPPLTGGPGLRILLDGPIVEVFAGTSGALAAVLPTTGYPDPPRLEVAGPAGCAASAWSIS